MRWTDGFRIAFETLIQNPLRTFLTLIGIAIGVMAIIFVVSVIGGLNQYVADAFSDLGADSFIVDRFGIIKGHTAWIRAARRNKELKMTDAEAIARYARLPVAVGVKRERRGTVRFGSGRVDGVNVRGLDFGALDIEPYDIEQGRMFLPFEDQRAVQVCFLGHEIAQELFPSVDPIGKKVRIWGRSFSVVGVAARKGSIFGQSLDNFVVIPQSVFRKVHGSAGSIQISVRAPNEASIEATIDEVRAIMRARHHLAENEPDDFGILTAEGFLGFWRDITGLIFRLAVFVVSISLVVGGIVIMNIMLLTVVERTREIGVRKATGARQSDIQLQFLLESVMLCALGGLVGVGLGWLVSHAISAMTPLPTQFPLWAPILAVAVTSGVGIFFGLHPARQAAGLDPIEALRAEEV